VGKKIEVANFLEKIEDCRFFGRICLDEKRGFKKKVKKLIL
jgi:hypothetical protein